MKIKRHTLTFVLLALILLAACQTDPATKPSPTEPSGETVESADNSLVAEREAPLVAQQMQPGETPSTEPLPLELIDGRTEVAVFLPEGTTDQYVLSAETNQVVAAEISASNDAIAVEIVGADGIRLAQGRSWTGTVNAGQTITLKTAAESGEGDYTLSIEALPLLTTGAEPSKLAQSLEAGGVSDFVWSGTAGQQLSVEVASADGTVLLEIVGTGDNAQILRAAEGATSWSGELPSSQLYRVRTIAVADSVYELTVGVGE